MSEDRWDHAKCYNAVVTLNDNIDKIDDEYDKVEIFKLVNVEPPVFSGVQAKRIQALWVKYANGEPD